MEVGLGAGGLPWWEHWFAGPWFCETDERIVARTAHQTVLLTIVCAVMRMVFDNAWNEVTLANAWNVQERVEVDPFPAVLGPSLATKRDCDAAHEERTLDFRKVLTDHDVSFGA